MNNATSTLLSKSTSQILAKSIYQEICAKIQSDFSLDLTTITATNEKTNIEAKVQAALKNNYANQNTEALQRVEDEFLKAGPLEPLLNDSSVTEILINNESEIWIEKNGSLEKLQDTFFTFVSYQNFLQRLIADARLQINLERPYVDGYWRQYRIHLIIPPIARQGPTLSLRRHPENPWTLERFGEMNWAPADALEILRKLVNDRLSFLVIGPTGSGKTSVLNACLQEVENNERIIMIEDTNELQAPNNLTVKLTTRMDANGVLPNVDQTELLRQALRMRPDRIVVGEVRGAEAKDLVMALSTGHRGGMSTLHADNARQALYRLEMLIQMGAPQWSLGAIRSLIHFGLQAIICVEKINGERRLKQICRLASMEENGFSFECLWDRANTQHRKFELMSKI